MHLPRRMGIVSWAVLPLDDGHDHPGAVLSVADRGPI
jgi:hypothetical protein